MAERFDYIDAPQFFDFTKNNSEDDDDLEKYFVYDHEGELQDPLQMDKKVDAQNGELDDPLQEDVKENGARNSITHDLRRSMSFNDILYLQTALKDFTILRKEKTAREIKKPTCNIPPVSETKQSRFRQSREKHGSLDLATQRAKSQEFVDRLARPKQYSSLETNLNVNQYVSIAEAVRNFQSDTPDRFHSRKKGECNLPVQEKMPPITKPHTPRLLANKRTRPVNVLSREDREFLEFKEEQKFKIKANPLNKKVLHGPVKAPILKKPSTIPEPFNLTRLPPKKIVPSVEKVPEFHAKPVPESVRNKPIVARPAPQTTVPQTPTFMKRYPKQSPKRVSQPKEEPKQEFVKNRRTQPMPFSFEVRDQQIMKKKENFIKKVLEEEKKAREFHANPIPKTVLQQSRNVSLPKNGSQRSLEKIQTSNENLSTQFKARPATVLQKKPFVPKPSDKPIPTFSEFKLSTEERTESREKFKQRVMEIEEQKKLYREQEELRLKQEEAAEIAKQRKMAEHKAQPIRKYKEVHVEYNKQLTVAISPKIHVNRIRQSHNKENMGNN